MRKRKIGIVTILDNTNMGNRLQNYAVQEIYRDLGFKPVTLGRVIGLAGIRKKIGLWLYMNLIYVGGVAKHFLGKSTHSYFFGKFNRRLKFSHRLLNPTNAKKIAKHYDFLSVGSDQVWNPKFSRLNEIDLLTFSPKQKNISISASIGIDGLKGECDEEFVTNAFLNFSHISVRETRAKEIIEEMTGRKDVEVFLDPTLLLSQEKWQQIERGGVHTNQKKYIFLFFLSDLAEETHKQIYRFADKNGYEVLEWSPSKNELKSRVGPSEWLYLVHHASCVCTDSFHACAFSLNFNVPFVYHQRDFYIKMNSRIETLKQKFSLEGIEYDGSFKIPDMDFDNVNKTLKEERQRTYALLKTWLR